MRKSTNDTRKKSHNKYNNFRVLVDVYLIYEDLPIEKFTKYINSLGTNSSYNCYKNDNDYNTFDNSVLSQLLNNKNKVRVNNKSLSSVKSNLSIKKEQHIPIKSAILNNNFYIPNRNTHTNQANKENNINYDYNKDIKSRNSLSRNIRNSIITYSNSMSNLLSTSTKQKTKRKNSKNKDKSDNRDNRAMDLFLSQYDLKSTTKDYIPLCNLSILDTEINNIKQSKRLSVLEVCNHLNSSLLSMQSVNYMNNLVERKVYKRNSSCIMNSCDYRNKNKNMFSSRQQDNLSNYNTINKSIFSSQYNRKSSMCNISNLNTVHKRLSKGVFLMKRKSVDDVRNMFDKVMIERKNSVKNINKKNKRLSDIYDMMDLFPDSGKKIYNDYEEESNKDGNNQFILCKNNSEKCSITKYNINYLNKKEFNQKFNELSEENTLKNLGRTSKIHYEADSINKSLKNINTRINPLLNDNNNVSNGIVLNQKLILNSIQEKKSLTGNLSDIILSNEEMEERKKISTRNLIKQKQQSQNSFSSSNNSDISESKNSRSDDFNDYAAYKSKKLLMRSNLNKEGYDSYKERDSKEFEFIDKIKMNINFNSNYNIKLLRKQNLMLEKYINRFFIKCFGINSVSEDDSSDFEEAFNFNINIEKSNTDNTDIDAYYSNSQKETEVNNNNHDDLKDNSIMNINNSNNQEILIDDMIIENENPLLIKDTIKPINEINSSKTSFNNSISKSKLYSINHHITLKKRQCKDMILNSINFLEKLRTLVVNKHIEQQYLKSLALKYNNKQIMLYKKIKTIPVFKQSLKIKQVNYSINSQINKINNRELLDSTNRIRIIVKRINIQKFKKLDEMRNYELIGLNNLRLYSNTMKLNIKDNDKEKSNTNNFTNSKINSNINYYNNIFNSLSKDYLSDIITETEFRDLLICQIKKVIEKLETELDKLITKVEDIEYYERNKGGCSIRNKQDKRGTFVSSTSNDSKSSSNRINLISYKERKFKLENLLSQCNKVIEAVCNKTVSTNYIKDNKRINRNLNVDKRNKRNNNIESKTNSRIELSNALNTPDDSNTSKSHELSEEEDSYLDKIKKSLAHDYKREVFKRKKNSIFEIINIIDRNCQNKNLNDKNINKDSSSRIIERMKINNINYSGEEDNSINSDYKRTYISEINKIITETNVNNKENNENKERSINNDEYTNNNQLDISNVSQSIHNNEQLLFPIELKSNLNDNLNKKINLVLKEKNYKSVIKDFPFYRINEGIFLFGSIECYISYEDDQNILVTSKQTSLVLSNFIDYYLREEEEKLLNEFI